MLTNVNIIRKALFKMPDDDDDIVYDEDDDIRDVDMKTIEEAEAAVNFFNDRQKVKKCLM